MDINIHSVGLNKIPVRDYLKSMRKEGIKKGQIEKLPVNLIKNLYDKLSTKTKGDWKQFAQELEKLNHGL